MDWCSGFCRWLFCCKSWDKKSAESSLLGSEKNFAKPPGGSYTVRRISSFGQVVVNEKGEECEIGRHSNILQSLNGQPVPLPWLCSPTTVQPGVTEEEFTERLKRMPTISESEPVGMKMCIEKSIDVNGGGEPNSGKKKHERQRSPWRRALANVRFRAGDKTAKSELFLRQFSGASSETLESTLESGSTIVEEKKAGKKKKKNKRKKRLGMGNVRKASYLAAIEPYPITESTPDLRQTEDPMTMDTPYCTVETVSSVELREAAQTILAEGLCAPAWLKSQSFLNVNSDTVKQEESSDRLAKMYGLNPELYKDTSSTRSNEVFSNDSIHNIWPQQYFGLIVFTLQIDRFSKQLLVNVNEIDGISGEGPTSEKYPAVVKLCLLPGKRCQRESQPQTDFRHLNLQFTLNYKDPVSSILRLSVYNSEWMGSYDAVGHALFHLKDAKEEMTLYEMKLSNRLTPDESVGLLHMSMTYSDSCFNINIIRAFDLIPQLCESRSKLYLKVVYYSMSKKMKEKSSEAGMAIGDEVQFNYSVKFKGVYPLGGGHDYISISLKKREQGRGMFKRDATKGRIIIGPWLYAGIQFTPWGTVLLSNQKLVKSFHMYL